MTLSVHYDNAVAAAERSLRSANARSRESAATFVATRTCSVCHGTRLRPEALTSRLGGRTIAGISALTLEALGTFAGDLPASLPDELSRLTSGCCGSSTGCSRRCSTSASATWRWTGPARRCRRGSGSASS